MKEKIFTYVWISIVVGMITFIIFAHDKTVINFVLFILIAFAYSFVIGFGNKYMNQFLNQKYSWIDETSKRTVYGIAGTIFINVVLVLACNYVNLILLHGRDAQDFFKGGLMLSNWISINIALLISAILHAKGFMQAWKEASKAQVSEQKLIAKSANAQFESLKNQLDPHFLFNSLNVLSALIEENPEQATIFTNRLSKIYRYVLEQKTKNTVPIKDEITFAKIYSQLLKTRFEDAIHFDFRIPKEAQALSIVPLSLQLLLENVVKHNIATSTKALYISIYKSNNQLIVENNIQLRKPLDNRKGIGLENIIKRYALLTNEEVIIEKTDKKFSVKIPILDQEKRPHD